MGAASSWVRRFAALALPGEVLDLACGTGRHARLFAALGHPVLALDRDLAALEQAGAPAQPGQPGAALGLNTPNTSNMPNAPITTMAFDLEDAAQPWPFAAGRFAAIVVTNYLHRPLLPALLASLAPDGVLLYETFAAGNEQFGRPANPHFLLGEGELLALAAGAGLRVVAYECGLADTPKPAMLQRLCAVGREFPRTSVRLAESPARF